MTCSPENNLERSFSHIETELFLKDWSLKWLKVFPSGWDSALQMQGAQIQPLVGEQRSHMLHRVA